MSAPAPAPPHLRNAFLIHGLAVAVLAVLWLAQYFPELTGGAAFHFQLTGLVSAIVLIVWSVAHSIRAVCDGARRRWPVALWVLAAVELNAPAVYAWIKLPQGSARGLGSLGSLGTFQGYLCAIDYPILVPLITAFVLLAIVTWLALKIRATSRWRTPAFVAVGSMGACILFVIFPCAQWVLSATGIQQRCAPPRAAFFVQSTPDAYKVATVRLLSWMGMEHAAAYDSGKLPLWWLIRALNDPAEAHLAWRSIPEEFDLEVAEAIAENELPAVESIQSAMGQCLVTKADRRKMTKLLEHANAIPSQIRSAIFVNINDYETSQGHFNALDRMLSHGCYIDAEALDAWWRLSASQNESFGFISFKVNILTDWLKIRSQTAPRSGPEMDFLVQATRNSDLRQRRLAVVALADAAHIPLHSTPFSDAGPLNGDPPPFTKAEADEADKVIAAQLQPAGSDELKRRALAGKAEIREWLRYSACFPVAALETALDLAENDRAVEPAVENCAGEFAARRAAASEIRTLLKKRLRKNFLKGFLAGIRDYRRSDFNADLKDMDIHPDEFLVPLCVLLTHDEAENRFFFKLYAGDEAMDRLIVNGCGYIQDERLRLSYVRLMLNSKYDAHARYGVAVQASVLDLRSFESFDGRFDCLGMLVNCLNNSDLPVRRAAVHALADSLEMRLVSTPMPADVEPGDPPLLKGGRPLAEQPREANELNELRRKIAPDGKEDEEKK